MLRPLVQHLAREVSGRTCMDHIHMIARHHRIQASPGYRAAALECLQALQKAGLEANIRTYPATGRHWEWNHLTPREWNCQDAELWLTDETGRPAERLAWFHEANLAVIQRSCATAPAGVAADLAAVDNAEEAAAWAGANAAGKIVLVGNGDIHRIWRHARKAGALGLITARMTYNATVRPEGDLPDALQYTSFWWSEHEPQGWGFVISMRQGARLRDALRRGPVRLWARVDAEFRDGTIENVEGIIPGTGEGEVLVVSHLCHPRPSANDNATGPAVVMEAARVLNRLIERQTLARPRRSIRFLHPPEMTGTFAHLAALAPEQRDQIRGALNVDMVGQNQALTGSVLLCEYPPLSCPSYAGDLLSLVLGEVAREAKPLSGRGPGYGLFRHAVTPFSGGSDHYILSDPTVGIPCPMLIQWPDRFYHTSEDTPDKADPDMLRRVSMMTAAYAYFLASADASDVSWLAAEMAALFPAQLHEALRDAADPEAVAGFRVDRKLADLESLRRLLDPPEQEEAAAAIRACANQIKVCAEMELQRLALSGACALSPEPGAGRVLPPLRPLRTQPGPVSLRNHLGRLGEEAQEAWETFDASHPGAARMTDYLLYWADGRRTLAEICRLTELETGWQDPDWALEYFHLLARLGLITGV